MVEILCKVNPKYIPFVSSKNGQKTLYLQLLRALYGYIHSALLWYELFLGTLQNIGFKLNLYDRCVANKTINGKQCTIAWYVDNNKRSHVDPKIVDGIINKIEEKFGKMTVTRGKKHTFVIMDIEFATDKCVKILMHPYLREAITEFGEDVACGASSPARNDLVRINPNAEPLTKTKCETLHSIAAKLLFVSKRACLDL